MDETDLEKLDGITNGAGAANKAVVLDANADIASGLRNITTSGTITSNAGVVVDNMCVYQTVTWRRENSRTPAQCVYIFMHILASPGAHRRSRLRVSAWVGLEGVLVRPVCNS